MNQELCFRVLGHAGLQIKTPRFSLLVDPWLVGSCYWRSWWQYPPAVLPDADLFQPDYIYLTHHHFDHFHFPTLRKMDKNATVLIPKFAVDQMRAEVEGVGFRSVIEMPHGEPLELPGGAVATSYQYGTDDTALFVRSGTVVLADLSDCKLMGRPAQQALRDYGSPTFLFRAHSFAQAFPNCYDFESRRDRGLLCEEHFVDSFLSSVQQLKPQYAVPFASSIAFLHPESWKCNRYVVRPSSILAGAKRMGLSHSKIEILHPGDGWSVEGGFHREEGEDYFADIPAKLEALKNKATPSIVKQTEVETESSLSFEKFREYFLTFSQSLPLPVRWGIKRPIVFVVRDGLFWVVDVRKRQVYSTTALPEGRANCIRTNSGMLGDAIDKKIVNFIHISMRIGIQVRRGGVSSDFCFWGFLTVYELGYFPLRRLFTFRAVGVFWRRRAEIFSILIRLLSKGGIFKAVVKERMPAAEQTAG